MDAQRTDESPPDPHPFGAALRKQRVTCGMPQKELARLSGVSEGWIRLLEKGLQKPKDRVYTSRPSPEHAVKLARALDWDVTEALAVAGHDPNVVPEVEMPDLDDRLARLTPGQRTLVSRVLDFIEKPAPVA